MANCGFEKIVGNLCGTYYPEDSECVSIQSCQKEVNSHLGLLHAMAETVLISEKQLIFARAGKLQHDTFNFSAALDHFPARISCIMNLKPRHTGDFIKSQVHECGYTCNKSCDFVAKVLIGFKNICDSCYMGDFHRALALLVSPRLSATC